MFSWENTTINNSNVHVVKVLKNHTNGFAYFSHFTANQVYFEYSFFIVPFGFHSFSASYENQIADLKLIV